jgi:hypothetical protein
MLDSLSTVPELTQLRTRNDTDFSIALLDAWAIVCDILTFYQERIANESYLRTATERVSVAELAKLIGYMVRPGVAASVALALTVDAPVVMPAGLSVPPSGAPPWVPLDAGIRVQSTPDSGQQPATFETTTSIKARAAWNTIGPRLRVPLDGGIANTAANVRLDGLQSAPQIGDSLLLLAHDVPESPSVKRVIRVEPDNDSQTTLVVVESGSNPTRAALPTTIPSARPGPLDDAFLWTNVKGHVWADQTGLLAFAQSQNWSVDQLENAINALRGQRAPGVGPPVRAFVLKTRASLFGHNAPLWDSLPPSLRYDSSVQKVDGNGTPVNEYTRIPAPFFPSWEGATLTGDKVSKGGQRARVDLDSTYPSLVVGGWLVLSAPAGSPFGGNLDGDVFEGSVLARHIGAVVPTLLERQRVFAARIVSSNDLSRSDYLLSAKVTEVELDATPASIADFPIRTTHVLGSTGELPVADMLDDEVVVRGQLTLDAAYLSLKVGQLVAVTGARADKQGETASEVVTIAALALVDGYTTATFAPALMNQYVRASVRIDANVAQATHGETRSEILGSGDARLPFQRFGLKQAPLTYVSAATETGTTSTLAVRVNGIQWREVDWLYGASPTDLIYTVVKDADGKTYVQFGDGATGARVPSGTNNIQATYRIGIGSSGSVRAGQLTTLLSRPLGLKAATNPLASTGAGDPETVDQARDNAPIAIRTLGRIVSLEDFADFARASAAIAKAGVTWLWDGTQQVACVTVAGTGGQPVVAGTPQFDNLLIAMRNAGDGCVPMMLCPFVPRAFTVSATLTIDPTYLASAVLDAVKSALRTAFSFEARDFGQPVFRSEVIATVQNVPGVIAMALVGFAYTGAPPASPPPDALVANAPTLGLSGALGAELLTLEAGPLPGVVVGL